ncbi:GNAT family N-acetyltransferase [Roseibium sp. SCP14]|uniref:GNAT family N-acetyltransferase n=1 Tax=Roseibium sp. SCP14 TaxID=3141375 RepID=UPI0033380C0D
MNLIEQNAFDPNAAERTFSGLTDTSSDCSLTLELNPGDFHDWARLLDFLKIAFAHTQGRVSPPSTVYQMTAKDVAMRAAQEDLLLAFSGKALSGCLFLKEEADALFLGRFAIAADHQGSGLARRMLSVAEARAREKNLCLLKLETRVSLKENQEKFMRLGFDITGSRCHTGYSEPTTLIMCKHL